MGRPKSIGSSSIRLIYYIIVLKVTKYAIYMSSLLAFLFNVHVTLYMVTFVRCSDGVTCKVNIEQEWQKPAPYISKKDHFRTRVASSLTPARAPLAELST